MYVVRYVLNQFLLSSHVTISNIVQTNSKISITHIGGSGVVLNRLTGDTSV